MIDTYGLTKTLGVIDICTRPNGTRWFVVGNNSIIFRIRHDGRDKMLKCYTRDKRNLRLIYGEKCLHDELYVHSDYNHGEWVDVIVDDWIEGVTLQQAIINNLADPEALGDLAEKFDRMAMWLLDEDWAHGDLKPENIMLTPEGKVRLIDFDAVFRPEMAGETSEEIGTAAFQHPARNVHYFNSSIDDYSIALISTALHALALDPSLALRYDVEDMLLMHPRDILSGKTTALEEILPLFADKGRAIPFQIAKMLYSQSPSLPMLRTFLGYKSYVIPPEEVDNPEPPTLCHTESGCGFCRNGQYIIPPVYSFGVDFADGVAAVCIGQRWHHIDRRGIILEDSPRSKLMQTLENGATILIENDVIGFDKSKSY